MAVSTSASSGWPRRLPWQVVGVGTAVERVGTDAAGDQVVAAPSEQGVVALTAEQAVGSGVADQRVIVVRALHPLEPNERVTVGPGDGTQTQSMVTPLGTSRSDPIRSTAR